MKTIQSLLVFFVLAGVMLGGCTESGGEPSYKQTDCLFTAPYGAEVECGNLWVPEDRSNPDSRLIQIHVAIVKSKSGHPAPDPIVILEGGPGASALASIGYYLDIFDFARDDRDLILIDQRGVGYSQPALNCPEMEQQFYQYLVQNITLEQELALDTQAAQACHDRLIKEGVNLAAYTSADSSTDIEDLRIALGYKQWNLYGSSYGTRLALTTMREYPQGIRSVILDSVYPPQVDIYAEVAANGERSFKLLFERCAADPKCAAAFPDLQTVFVGTVDQLDENPVMLNLTNPPTGRKYEMLMNGRRLVASLFNLLYSSTEIPKLPKMIYQVSRGEWSEAAVMLQNALFIPEYFDEGMNYSVECSEEASFSSEQLIEKAIETVDLHYTRALAWTPTLMACSFWRIHPVEPVENEPVLSEIPTLVFAGGYDPVTPPHWGRQTAEKLKNAQFIEFPNFGHGVLGSGMDGGKCTQKILDAFLTDPVAELDDVRCIQDLTFFFITR